MGSITPQIDPAMPGKVFMWASAQTEITKVWLYGSRAKGTARPDSDIDLAVEINGDEDCSALGNWVCLARGWRIQLAAILGDRVHLQPAWEDDTIVLPAVLDHGICLYDSVENDPLRI